MRPDIHPEYVETQVTCTCGNTFTTRSTAKDGTIHADVCSACHPFYTGKQKILDSGGRVAKFEKRFGKEITTEINPLLSLGLMYNFTPSVGIFLEGSYVTTPLVGFGIKLR